VVAPDRPGTGAQRGDHRHSTEREYKFAVPPGWVVPSLDPSCRTDSAEVVEQTATYYDTPDLRLVRAGASIRFRDDDGWTVKLPVDDHESGGLVRSEHVFGGSSTAPPPEALELVAARVRTSRLVPVARLHTVRHRSVLRSAPGVDDVDGRPVAILTDDECRVLEGRVRAVFREVELEVAEDAPDDVVDAIAAQLRASGASDADPSPKVVRALGAVASSPADVRSYDVDRPATVDAVVRHALSDSVLKLVTNDPLVRIGEDVEGVHQARVATRRLRSHLRTFRELLDPDWTEALRTELGWLGDELGAVRDCDVLLARLRDRVAHELDEADREAAAPLIARVAEQHAAARARLLESLRGTRYLELLDRLVEAAHRPRVVMRLSDDDEKVLRRLVRRPWKQLRKAVEELADPAPDAALHAVRIRAKRARYAAEVVEPAFGKRARAFAKSLTDVQDALGEHQDAVVAGAWLRATALSLGDPAAAYAAGVLGAAERRAAEAARATWPRVWRAAARKRLRSWL
jgi:CHAD domain-containing protein